MLTWWKKARGKRGDTSNVLAPAAVIDVDLKSKVFRPAKALSVLDFRFVLGMEGYSMSCNT